MIRKEELIIGTKSEIDFYYRHVLNVGPRNVRNMAFPPGTYETNVEFKPLHEQVAEMKSDFGKIFYYKVLSEEVDKKEPLPFSSPLEDGEPQLTAGSKVKLVLTGFFVWLQPITTEEFTEKLFKGIRKKSPGEKNESVG